MTFASWSGLIAGGLGALLAAGYVTQKICEARDSTRYPPPGRMVDIGGRRLHVLCKGAGPGPTVLIEQGLAGPSILWWPVQDAVAQFARVCTYDRAGFQWSDPAPAGRGALDAVADLHTLLSNAEIAGPYVLVGHSFGGPLVRLFARQYPTDVAGVVLVDTPDESILFRKSFADYNRSLRRMFLVMQAAAQIGAVRLAMRFQDSEGLPPDAARTLSAMVARSSFFRAARENSHVLSRIPAPMQGPGGLGALENLPLSVITHGIPFPGQYAVLENGWTEGQQNLAGLSSDSELIIATKSNHMINTDEPELVVNAIRRVHAAARDRTRLNPLPAGS